MTVIGLGNLDFLSDLVMGVRSSELAVIVVSDGLTGDVDGFTGEFERDRTGILLGGCRRSILTLELSRL